MSNRFRGFLEHIIEDGEWEYDDGPNMTEDARQFLEHHDRLRSEMEAADEREAGLIEAARKARLHIVWGSVDKSDVIEALDKAQSARLRQSEGGESDG